MKALIPFKEHWDGVLVLSKKKRNFLWDETKTCGKAIQNLLKSCLSYGHPNKGRRVLIRKNWRESRMKNFNSEMWRNKVWVELVKISRDSSCMTVLMHSWLNLVTKLQKYTPLAYSPSTSEECKKWDVVSVCNQESDLDWIWGYQFVKTRLCARGLLSKIWAWEKFKQSLNKVYEIKSGD